MAHTAAKAYPLAWPNGRPRSSHRSHSKFGDRTLAKSLDALKAELSRLGAQYVVVSSNVPLKANGDPYSDPGRMPDPGVAVYFQLKSKPYSLSCDKWISVEDNMYALAKHIEAMRGQDRWGVGTVEQAFAGFKELPNDTGPDWWNVLGISEDASIEEIQRAHRAKAMHAHPDRGGSEAAMQQINVARDRALKERE